ncbi:glycosyltransferase [Streptomyces sp. NPDC050485]|uniref:glycosyltransferase n=1 Tax=Streptomyces sp. NPDC050485 TaxID=3365617 RepID=UPI0037A3E987
MTVRVAITTVGSRGDAAPYAGLADGLVAGGHHVTVVTHACFEPPLSDSPAGFHPLPIDPRAELRSARGQVLHHSRTGPGMLARVVSLARSLAGEMADDLLQAAQASDVLLLAGSVTPLGYAIADGLGLPSAGLNLQPIHATGAFAPPMTGGGTGGRTGQQGIRARRAPGSGPRVRAGRTEDAPLGWDCPRAACGPSAESANAVTGPSCTATARSSYRGPATGAPAWRSPGTDGPASPTANCPPGYGTSRSRPETCPVRWRRCCC